MSSELEKVTEDIDIAVDLLDLLKSRYFFLRAKYDIGKYMIYFVFIINMIHLIKNGTSLATLFLFMLLSNV